MFIPTLLQITEYSYGVEIAYPCYILVDVVVVVLMTYAITCALPCERLKPDRPTASLFSPSTMFSTLGLFAIYGTVFFVSLALMSNDPQYLQWPARLAPTSAWWLNGESWASNSICSSCIPHLKTPPNGKSRDQTRLCRTTRR